jgi:hypothetical protein
LLAVAVSCWGLLACSSSSSGQGTPACSEGGGGGSASSGGGSCSAYVSCADLTTPTVSFAADVLPILDKSCGIGGGQCHGNPNVGKQTGQPYLGQSPGTPDVAKIFAGIIGQPAEEDTQMNLVEPGDPSKSFLMHKLDGDSCLYASVCNSTGNPMFKNCGIQMPFNMTALDITQRDTIRRWIAQGAKND